MYWSSATPLAMEIDDRIALPLTIELISDPKAEPQVRPCPAPAIQRRGLAWPAAVAAPFNVPRLAVTLPPVCCIGAPSVVLSIPSAVIAVD